MIGFFSRWKKGMMELTPQQILQAKITGQIGQIIGLGLAMVVIAFSEHKYFLLFLFFTVFILVTELIRTYKEYEVMLKWI
jgi:uncharacterized membrane protein YgaE (UPF0421/DUF939 family)